MRPLGKGVPAQSVHQNTSGEEEFLWMGGTS